MTGWNTYYNRQAARPASRLLMQALAHTDDDAPLRVALDLGCGNGHESRALQQRGWHVHAYDREDAAIQRLRALPPLPPPAGSLTVHQEAFEALQQMPAASFIHAGLSLPFCAPEAFSGFWRVTRAAWQPAGVFAGHFFGPRDAWAADPGMSFHGVADIHQLFEGCELLHLDEFEGMAPSLAGPKYWHRIEVIARNAGGESGSAARAIASV
ncbi:MAG: class I SAM-dependent methyltransferase [Comamonadaceae bacterium]|nr:MAG: class I SAM-dependent methyltransferase [Comamonadaceae bacterium]